MRHENHRHAWYCHTPAAGNNLARRCPGTMAGPLTMARCPHDSRRAGAHAGGEVTAATDEFMAGSCRVR